VAVTLPEYPAETMQLLVPPVPPVPETVPVL
jgi:hypothetical protein